MDAAISSASMKPDAVSDIESKMRSEVRDIGIPPRPAILDRIRAEMNKSEPDFNHLAQLIGSDVGLAAGLIKVANSPYYGFSRRVRSVQDALMVLGLKVIVRTIAGLELQKCFPKIPSLDRFWDTSACTARVSGWLVQECDLPRSVRPDDAYTFGLFRDCGIPTLMIPFPEYQDILKQANTEAERSFTDVEDQLLSINHAGVGADLAEDWLLPEEIYLAIRYHHDVFAIDGTSAKTIPDTTRYLIALAQLAEHLIQHHTKLDRTAEWDKLGAACLTRLDIGEQQFQKLHEASQAVVSGDS